ncbi:hypothetical protein DQ04_05511010 [Trypanosoma grayi]|uniref:hypothetical protein n=1 Tax=Trypanosoma grayi TaxID=71804 RepID=UPI0004F470B4|nr:hypothetical protein DQ04_05511010 [Trypanosoma grayi]KEG09266.1 hypothetical protein DQ04_05511010 [Trypanosoma grayi]
MIMSLRRVLGCGILEKSLFIGADVTSGTLFLQQRIKSQEARVYHDVDLLEETVKSREGVSYDDSAASPSTLLRKIKHERELAAEKIGLDKVPQPPLRRSGKNIVMEENTNSGANSTGSQHKPNDSVGGSATLPPRNHFLQKLSEMEKSSGFSGTCRKATSRAHEGGVEEKVLEERKRMLVFRDVGMDLDKPILSRDVFLVLKYFRYGIEFAVDNELERMLRYFNEHALNELKIIQNSKLMRGPASLSRKKINAGHGVLPFQVTPSFPSFQAANMRQFCRYTKETEQKANDILKSTSFCTSFHRKNGDAMSRTDSITPFFCESNSTQMTMFSPSMFRRPAVIIYSQLGQKLGAQADLEWRHLAYTTLYPSLLQYLPETDIKGEGHVLSPSGQHRGGLRHRSGGTFQGVKGHAMPIDIISLRSMDVYKYRWVHKLYVRRFAQSLFPSVASSDCATSDSQVNGVLTASSTFVGCKLLQPFYPVLGLRNYLSPHVMLVDHEGRIRWLSAGCPDDYEREHFPALLKQLADEYFEARSR